MLEQQIEKYQRTCGTTSDEAFGFSDELRKKQFHCASPNCAFRTFMTPISIDLWPSQMRDMGFVPRNGSFWVERCR